MDDQAPETQVQTAEDATSPLTHVPATIETGDASKNNEDVPEKSVEYVCASLDELRRQQTDDLLLASINRHLPHSKRARIVDFEVPKARPRTNFDKIEELKCWYPTTNQDIGSALVYLSQWLFERVSGTSELHFLDPEEFCFDETTKYLAIKGYLEDPRKRQFFVNGDYYCYEHDPYRSILTIHFIKGDEAKKINIR
jgi:hypothetical protein